MSVEGKIEREKDVGPVEYKLKIVGKDEKRIDELTSLGVNNFVGI